MKTPKLLQVIAEGYSCVTRSGHVNAKADRACEEFKRGYYETAERKLKAFATYEAARARAEQITSRLTHGDADPLGLDATQNATDLRAAAGVPLDVVASSCALTRSPPFGSRGVLLHSDADGPRLQGCPPAARC